MRNISKTKAEPPGKIGKIKLPSDFQTRLNVLRQRHLSLREKLIDIDEKLSRIDRFTG